MTPTAGRARARRGEGDRLAVDILDAAEELLVKHGDMDRVSMRKIADAVGVTPPAIYLHFDDKDELFFEVCARRFDEFGAALRSAAASSDGPIERLRATAHAYVRYGLERPAHYRILFADEAIVDPTHRDPDDLPGLDAFGLLVSLMSDGLSSGVLKDGDPIELAMSAWAAVHGLVGLITMGRDHAFELFERGGFSQPDEDTLVEATVERLIDGMRA